MEVDRYFDDFLANKQPFYESLPMIRKLCSRLRTEVLWTNDQIGQVCGNSSEFVTFNRVMRLVTTLNNFLNLRTEILGIYNQYTELFSAPTSDRFGSCYGDDHFDFIN